MGNIEFKRIKSFHIRVNIDAYFIHNYTVLFFLELYTVFFSMMQYKHLVQTYRRFPSIYCRVLPLTKYSILPTFLLWQYFCHLKSELPLGFSCAAVLDSMKGEKTPLGFLMHTFPHSPPVENHSCTGASSLSSCTPLLVSWLTFLSGLQRDSPCWLEISP